MRSLWPSLLSLNAFCCCHLFSSIFSEIVVDTFGHTEKWHKHAVCQHTTLHKFISHLARQAALRSGSFVCFGEMHNLTWIDISIQFRMFRGEQNRTPFARTATRYTVEIVGGIAEPGDNQHEHRQIKANDACPNTVCWVAAMGRERHRPDLPTCSGNERTKTPTKPKQGKSADEASNYFLPGCQMKLCHHIEFSSRENGKI